MLKKIKIGLQTHRQKKTEKKLLQISKIIVVLDFKKYQEFIGNLEINVTFMVLKKYF